MPVIQYSETTLASWGLRQLSEKAKPLRESTIFSQSQRKMDKENTNLWGCLTLSGGNPQI